MKAKDKTEEVLKSIHVLFSKAEPVEGSKKKVIIDKDRMMSLLKELNSCMYSMMDEYELTDQSKERANRAQQKKNDEMVLETRKKAEDIYAGAIMYTDHALDEIQEIIEKTKEDLEKVHNTMKEDLETRKKVLKDNQIDLKNRLSSLIDTQKYLMLIENENKRLEREKEKKNETIEWDDAPEKQAPEIIVNQDYFKAKALYDQQTGSMDMEIDEDTMQSLDEEYFAWKDGEEDIDKGEDEPKKGLFSFGRKHK